MYDSLGKSVEIFTGCLRDMYWWPDGFSYDQRNNWADPVVGNPDLETFNAAAKSEHLKEYIDEML